METLDRALNVQPALEGAPNEVGESQEEGILTGGPPNVDEIKEKPVPGVAVAPTLPLKLADTGPSRKRKHDQLLLSTYVLLEEMIHPPAGMVAPDPKGVMEIIHRWRPFNRVES